MTYTEEQVKDLIQTNLSLAEENAKLKEALSKEALLRESAEKKYFSLCERCMNLYITERDITPDTIFAQAIVPRFMSQEDFATGVAQHLVTILTVEREKSIFYSTQVENYKPRQ